MVDTVYTLPYLSRKKSVLVAAMSSNLTSATSRL